MDGDFQFFDSSIVHIIFCKNYPYLSVDKTLNPCYFTVYYIESIQKDGDVEDVHCHDFFHEVLMFFREFRLGGSFFGAQRIIIKRRSGIFRNAIKFTGLIED